MIVKQEGDFTLMSISSPYLGFNYLLVHAARWYDHVYLYNEDLLDSLQDTWDFVVQQRKI